MVIKDLAKALTLATKKEDVVFRLGGDEFALYIDDIKDIKKADELFKKITSNIDNIHIPELKDRKLYVSIGFAFASEKINQFDVIYSQADSAMYESKLKKGHSRTFN